MTTGGVTLTPTIPSPTISQSQIDLVRFEIGDTHVEGQYLTDAQITTLLTNYSHGQTVVSCLEYIITQLSTPDFKLDWMSVSNAQARSAFENMLKLKQQKYGISPGAVMTCTIKHAHRADSYEYSEEVNDEGLHYDDPSGGL